MREALIFDKIFKSGLPEKFHVKWLTREEWENLDVNDNLHCPLGFWFQWAGEEILFCLERMAEVTRDLHDDEDVGIFATSVTLHIAYHVLYGKQGVEPEKQEEMVCNIVAMLDAEAQDQYEEILRNSS